MEEARNALRWVSRIAVEAPGERLCSLKCSFGYNFYWLRRLHYRLGGSSSLQLLPRNRAIPSIKSYRCIYGSIAIWRLRVEACTDERFLVVAFWRCSYSSWRFLELGSLLAVRIRLSFVLLFGRMSNVFFCDNYGSLIHQPIWYFSLYVLTTLKPLQSFIKI